MRESDARRWSALLPLPDRGRGNAKRRGKKSREFRNGARWGGGIPFPQSRVQAEECRGPCAWRSRPARCEQCESHCRLARNKLRRPVMWRAVLLAVACAAFCSCAAAQGFPSKPIHIVVPYPAGGTTDLMARALQEPMQKTLGQPVIVDNKPG